MTERTVHLTDREILALAYAEAADVLADTAADVFNQHPSALREDLSQVAKVLEDLHDLMDLASVGAASGFDGLFALYRKLRAGKEDS